MSAYRKFFLSLAFSFAMLSACRQTDVVSLADFSDPSCADDVSVTIRQALDFCSKHNVKVLEIPSGIYDIYPELLPERYEFVSNNSADLKRILFDLNGFSDFEIRADSARFVFHGYVCPFSVSSCSNVRISGLSIDYSRTFHSEGLIVSSGEGYADLLFSDDYPWRISNGCLHFCDTLGNDYPVSHLLEFDSSRREPAYKALDYWLSDNTVPAVALPDGSVRIFHPSLSTTPGNILLLGPAHRKCPSFFIDRSDGIAISDVTIFHCGGMGVVAQMSSDIELRSVRVIPREDRMISITADATHFTHCTGEIRMIDCDFFNQVDDATNIHGMYGIVRKIFDDGTMRVFFPHDQQYGLDILEKGDSVEILTQRNLITHTVGRVKHVSRLNKEWYEVRIDRPVSDVQTGDLITTMEYPDVLISGCRMQGNRARGLLLGSRASTVIENCYFHTPGSAILFEGDGYYWYEQAGARNVVIRNNCFDRCMYGAWTWGRAVIASGNGPREDRAESAYNRNISIEDNDFVLIDSRLLNIYSTDGCNVASNRISFSSDYSDDVEYDPGRMYLTDDCKNITIE